MNVVSCKECPRMMARDVRIAELEKAQQWVSVETKLMSEWGYEGTIKEPVYEAIINDDTADTIDPVIEIIIRTDGHDYQYSASQLQSLIIREMNDG